jgi:hypothetical protein
VAGVRCARKRAGKHAAHSFLPGDGRYNNRTLLQTFELSSHSEKKKKKNVTEKKEENDCREKKKSFSVVVA